MSCDTTVEEGATLSVEPGAILKAGRGHVLRVEGTLAARGTAAEPITFTSIDDDSVGGQTGSGSPAAGDWAGIATLSQGSVDLEHARVDYAEDGLVAEGSGGTVVKEDDFILEAGSAVLIDGARTPTLEGNFASISTATAGGPAYSVAAGALDLGLIGGNGASAELPVVQLSGVLGKSSTLSPSDAAWEIGDVVGGHELDVPEGKTLTVAPGTVVKAHHGTCGGGAPVGCSLRVEGTLAARGTAAEPITFTSIDDDSVGGQTGSGSPAAGDWAGIATLSQGSVDLEHARVDYAEDGLVAEGSGGTVVKEDDFILEAGSAVLIDGARTPTLEGNFASISTATAGGPAYSVAAGALDLGLIGGNGASAELPVVQLSGVLGKSSTLSPSDAAWEIGDVVGGHELDVPEGKTLTVAPGTVVKAHHGTCGGGAPVGCSLRVEGTLAARGTAAEPITFTSIDDDSVGGQTGSGSPAAGDWAGIATLSQGSVDLEHARVDYAEDGLVAEGSGGTVVKEDDFILEAGSAVLIDGARTPTLEGNFASISTATAGGPAYSVAAGALDLGLIGGNGASAELPVVQLSGVLGKSSTLSPSDAAWEIGDVVGGHELDVPEGKTLTVAPGTVVKAHHGTCGGGAPVGCSLRVEGTLAARGTAAEPITFTSIDDDSVGGQTGSGSPAAGDWAGIATLSQGSVDLEHARVDYAEDGLVAEGSGGTVVKEDDFILEAGSAVLIDGARTPTLEGNFASISTATAGGPAYSVAAGALDLGLIGGNGASAELPVVQLSGVLGKSSTLSPSDAAWEIGDVVGGHELDVPEGKTLTVAPGTVVKAHHGTCGGGAPVGCSLRVEGTLAARGTAAEPITFTSIDDDSVGGQTGSGSPAAGDWAGIATLSQGSVDLEHARVDYAEDGLVAEGSGGTVVKEDDFILEAGSAVLIDGARTPTLEGNFASISTATAGGPAYSVAAGALDLGLIGGNGASAELPVVQLSGVLGKSSTLSPSDAAWEIGDVVGGHELDVPEGKTLTVAPGTVVKAHHGTCGGGAPVGCSLRVEGTLAARGTAAEPITFTSIDDDSVGGQTGSGSPAAGDWAGIATLSQGSVDLEHARVDYATHALQVYGSGGVAVRGELVHNVSDIRACDWGESCLADASYVEWFDEGAPTSREQVCGQVTVSPYLVGGTSHTTGVIPKNCDGTEDPWEVMETGQQRFNRSVSEAQGRCYEFGGEVCETVENSFRCLSEAFDVGANQLPFAIPDPFSEGVEGPEWEGAATVVTSDASDWLGASAEPEIEDLGKIVSRRLQIVGVANTISAMASAYSRCSP